MIIEKNVDISNIVPVVGRPSKYGQIFRYMQQSGVDNLVINFKGDANCDSKTRACYRCLQNLQKKTGSNYRISISMKHNRVIIACQKSTSEPASSQTIRWDEIPAGGI